MKHVIPPVFTLSDYSHNTYPHQSDYRLHEVSGEATGGECSRAKNSRGSRDWGEECMGRNDRHSTELGPTPLPFPGKAH